jgi:F-type H+/Na+-transporting ATPase subunit alpha
MPDIKQSDLETLFVRALEKADSWSLEEIGTVIKVGDNMCRIYGLNNVLFGEMVEFDGGNRGVVFDLASDHVVVFFLYDVPVVEGEIVKRTGGVFQLGISAQMLGRVINPLGHPIDALGPINAQVYHSIETVIPGIVERSPVNESLETGIMAIDTLVPIGRGQRELIIGNRNTGKTSIAIDTIINQKGKDVLCIYVAIGQRQVSTARLINTLRAYGAMEYTVVVVADASDTVLNKYLAPFVGVTIAEFFAEQKKDVLIIYDDLSEHAIAYREMSLLMRRAPGREAYPGDIFYLHSHLLERAGKFLRGGSITALPIVQLQGGDLTAYIPTNLISITDGQIYLDTHLFNNGIRPAVNGELSVSRVGGAAQTKAIRQVTKSLRLDLAQYNELVGFSQFGTELDIVSQRQLARGEKAIEILKQQDLQPRSFVEQALMLFLFQNDFLDKIHKEAVRDFCIKFISYVRSVHKAVYETIWHEQEMSEATLKQLKNIAKEFLILNGVKAK